MLDLGTDTGQDYREPVQPVDPVEAAFAERRRQRDPVEAAFAARRQARISPSPPPGAGSTQPAPDLDTSRGFSVPGAGSFTPEKGWQPPPQPKPTQPTMDELMRQRMAGLSPSTRDTGLLGEYGAIGKTAAVAVQTGAQGLGSAAEQFRRIGRGEGADVLLGTEPTRAEPVNLPGGITESSAEPAAAANWGERLLGGLAGMGPTLLEPRAIAAMILTHAPSGATLASTPIQGALGYVSRVAGEPVAKATEAMLGGSVGMGAFSGVHAGMEGGQVLPAAGEGALQGAILAAPFAAAGLAGDMVASRRAATVEERQQAREDIGRMAPGSGPVISRPATQMRAEAGGAPPLGLGNLPPADRGTPEAGQQGGLAPAVAGGEPAALGDNRGVVGEAPVVGVPNGVHVLPKQGVPGELARGELAPPVEQVGELRPNRAAEDAGVVGSEHEAPPPQSTPDPRNLPMADLKARAEAAGIDPAVGRAEMVRQLRELSQEQPNAQQVTEAGPNDGGGGAQPGLRPQDGNTNEGRSGLQPGGQGRPEPVREAPAAVPQEGQEAAQAQRPVRGDVGASVDDIDAQLAERAFANTSHVPERRGQQYRQEYVDTFNRVRDELTALAKTPEQTEALRPQLERFRQGLADHYRSFFSSHANVASPMITGPARFPVEANAKRIRSADNRAAEIREFVKKATAAIRRDLFPTESYAVSSDRADAPDVLRQKIADAEKHHAAMLATNKIILDKKVPRENKQAKIAALGFTEERANELLNPKFSREQGFPQYALQNNRANIRRMQERVRQIEAGRAASAREATFGGGKVVENKDANRVQIFYDAKPDEATRTKLKSNGFRWSPREGAWQRLGNEAGWKSALYVTGAEAPTSPSVPTRRGMAATPGELIRGANETITGIAHRISEMRGRAAQRGEGIAPEESVLRGRELLRGGMSPAAVMANFEKTKSVSADDMAVARAHLETLSKAANAAADKHGVNSPEYKAAFAAESEWIKRTKPMQTEWHKIGQAQQGETEIDTGTFHGLQRAFHDATGKEFTPAQARTAERTAAKVQEASAAADAARERLYKAADLTPAVKSLSDRIVAKLDTAADAALARFKARHTGTTLRSGIDPADLADLSIYGAAKIAKGAVRFTEWSAEMVKDVGESIRPHLKEIWDAADKKLDEHIEAHTSEPEVKAAVRKAPPAELAGHVPGSKMTPERVKALWERTRSDYIEKGVTNFDDIVHHLAADTGLPVNDIRHGLAQPKGVRQITNEMYRKQAEARRVVENAKTWVREAGKPLWQRAAEKTPRAFFSAKVFGHGTVGMVTHAGNQAFNPLAAKSYWTNFGRQFRLVGLHDQGAFHEQAMADLQRRPNYVTARRAGLANDPARYADDYQKGVAGMLGKIGLSGNRGFDALKIFRQDLFDSHWDHLPESLKTPEMAQALADSANHATGALTRARAGGKIGATVLFAPKLEGSRWAFLIGDPAKAAKTFAGWKDATPEARYAAIAEVKQKALIAGTYFGALAVNQGLLSVSGSDQKINYTDPTRSDFLAFKAAGHSVGVVSPMIGTVRFLWNLGRAATERQKDLRGDSRAEAMYKVAGKYLRGKESPFAQVATDVLTSSDYSRRPMPWSSDKPPKYLRKQGVGRIGYGEYIAQTVLPIPAEEAVKEAWKSQGMGGSDIARWLRTIAVGVGTGATGARVNEDYAEKKRPARIAE